MYKKGEGTFSLLNHCTYVCTFYPLPSIMVCISNYRYYVWTSEWGVDNMSQLSHCQGKKLQISKAEGWNAPCGAGLELEIMVWTHTLFNTGICANGFHTYIYFPAPSSLTFRSSEHSAFKSWFLNTILHWRNQGFWEKWLILRLWQGKEKICLEYPVVLARK